MTKTKEQIAHEYALEKKLKLFPLRIKCWTNSTHAYRCGVYDGFLEGHSSRDDELAAITADRDLLDESNIELNHKLAEKDRVIAMLNREYADACKPHEQNDLKIQSLESRLDCAVEALENVRDYLASGSTMMRGSRPYQFADWIESKMEAK